MPKPSEGQAPVGMLGSAAENEADIRTGQVRGSGKKRAEMAGFRLQQVR